MLVCSKLVKHCRHVVEINFVGLPEAGVDSGAGAFVGAKDRLVGIMDGVPVGVTLGSPEVTSSSAGSAEKKQNN